MSEREQLLERLVAGETDTSDPAVQRLFRSDPTARADFEALRELEHSLERQGDRARDLIAGSEHIESHAGEQRVHATVHELAARGPGSRQSGPKRPGRLALALAAAALLTLTWGLWSRSVAPEGEIHMGDRPAVETVLIRPVNQVSAFAPFEWAGELPKGGWFEVRVHDASKPGADAILESGPVSDRSWDPKDLAPLKWPAKIQWTLTQYDASGQRVGSPLTAESWLP